MLFDCYVCDDPRRLAYRCQVMAESIDLAVIKFAKLEKFRPTHIRVRPLCRIAFKEKVRWFLFVYEHGLEPTGVYKKIAKGG